MSDAAYQKYIDGIDEALASIEINPKQVRQDIALQLIGGDAIHPELYTTVPIAQLQRIGQPDNRFDFIIDIIDNHINREFNIQLTDFHKITEVEGIGSFNTTRFVDMLQDVVNFADDILVEHRVNHLGDFNNLPVYLKQFVLHTAEFIGEATEMGTLPTTNELDVIPDLIAEYGIQDTELHPDFLTDIEDVYNRTDGVNTAPGFFNKYNRIGADAADIFKLAVNDTLRIPIEQSRGFMVESLNNRIILQLHSALQDPVHGGYIQNLLDEVKYEQGQNVVDELMGKADDKFYGSMSDRVDFVSDNAWYGIKNTTNRYVSLFREKLAQFIDGNVTGLYVPDDEVEMLHRISDGIEEAIKDFSETLLDISQKKNLDTKDVDNLITALDNETGRRLLNGFQEGGGLLGLGDLHTFFQSPGAPLQVVDASNFVLSDDAVKATGALNPDFIDRMLEVRKMTPNLVPEIQQTVQEMTNMLKPTIDNAYSVFEIKPPPNDIFHIRPLKEFLDYTKANQNVDVKFYNFNTSKFEDMGILGIVKSGVNNSPPDTLVIQVTPKLPDTPTNVVDDFYVVTPEQLSNAIEEMRKGFGDTLPEIQYNTHGELISELEQTLFSQGFDYRNGRDDDLRVVLDDWLTSGGTFEDTRFFNNFPKIENLPDPQNIRGFVAAAGGPEEIREGYVQPQYFKDKPNVPYTDTPTNVVDENIIVKKFIENIPETAGTAPTINKMIAETPQDIAEYVDKSKLPEVEKVLSNPKIGPAIASTAVDFAKKAGKFAFGGVMAGFAPGDIAIETAIRKLLPRLGLVAISGPALAAYTAYELGLLAADAGAAFAKKEQGEKFWDNFGEISDKYSIGYKLTKEIHNTLFEDVYGKMNQNVYAGADS
tara:strand:+ start:226 stop:2853 length:2628 start_codon:yes stop_codon:yes gene_type:complete